MLWPVGADATDFGFARTGDIGQRKLGATLGFDGRSRDLEVELAYVPLASVELGVVFEFR
ncbi:MAG: hypothetical protein R3E48_12595 [Burkholderiaceae bacterium]